MSHRKYMHLPLTISIRRSELESLFLPNFGLSNENPDNDILLPFNVSNIDWYLISSGDSKMALMSPPSLNFFSSTNSSTPITTPIRAMPLAKAIPVALVLSSIVVLCICGNILVILSVFTFRPLRTVQNFFIVSLAFSDMFVAIMVMPFHIVTHILKRWIFGQIFCQIFVTSDVLLCTSSILNLCAIALDRYWAISDPIQYARKRTLRRVLALIMLVWVLSATISIPPIIATMLGSSELNNFNERQQCELSNNKVYVIYSACGSFYIPALIMTIVYANVFVETRKRFRERAKAAAKLANATRRHIHPTSPNNLVTNNSIKHKHHHHKHGKKHAFKSSILHTTCSSLKSTNSNSNGSAQDNFSTDDAEETMAPKGIQPSNNNHLSQGQKSDINASQILVTINDDPNQMLPMGNNELTSSLYHQYPLPENKIENGSMIQQQNAAVQTTELLAIKKKSSLVGRSSKDGGRKSLFKGKSLAALMNERQKISLTRERRLSRTLGIIISVFLLCWLPFFLVYIISAFTDLTQIITEPISTFILWLGYMNSACNPLIYTIFNVEFRTAFKRLLFPSSMTSSLNRNYTNRQSRN